MRREEKKTIKVAAYARVSKDTNDMEDSYISQKKHAEEVISRNPEWILTKIYADQASGLNTVKRVGFNNMMKAARKHEMELILVKSISRFGRSVIDTLTAIREPGAALPRRRAGGRWKWTSRRTCAKD